MALVLHRISHVDQHQLVGHLVISSMAVKEARESSRPFSSKTEGLKAAMILRVLPSAKALGHENL